MEIALDIFFSDCRYDNRATHTLKILKDENFIEVYQQSINYISPYGKIKTQYFISTNMDTIDVSSEGLIEVYSCKGNKVSIYAGPHVKTVIDFLKGLINTNNKLVDDKESLCQMNQLNLW